MVLGRNFSMLFWHKILAANYSRQYAPQSLRWHNCAWGWGLVVVSAYRAKKMGRNAVGRTVEA